MSEQIEGVPLGMRIAKIERNAPECYWAVLAPDNVYQKPLDQVPDPPGHKRKQPLEFREPNIGEWFIADSGSCVLQWVESHRLSIDRRRIILEPPKPQERVLLFRQDISHPERAPYSMQRECDFPVETRIYGTATELPQPGTPEYSLLITRIQDTIITRFSQHISGEMINAVLAELFGERPREGDAKSASLVAKQKENDGKGEAPHA